MGSLVPVPAGRSHMSCEELPNCGLSHAAVPMRITTGHTRALFPKSQKPDPVSRSWVDGDVEHDTNPTPSGDDTHGSRGFLFGFTTVTRDNTGPRVGYENVSMLTTGG